MSIVVGRSYHIKDEFFSLVNDENLMTNKDAGVYCPHLFFIADPRVEGIYWAIPQSTRVKKYREIICHKIKKYGQCDTIVIGRFGGRESVFLIQNMFPVVEKYIDHEHTIDGRSVRVHNRLAEAVVSCANKILSLHRCGIKLVYPDIDRIYNLMKDELNQSI